MITAPDASSDTGTRSDNHPGGCHSSVAPTLVLGGVRSGKSRLAERLAGQQALESGGSVLYLATATVGEDAEMQARIQTHRARRPAHWGLMEEPLHLAEALEQATAAHSCVLVECLTLWLANLLWAQDEALLARELAALRALLPVLPGPVIFVSNETNQGVIPVDALARRYCDLAGALHQDIASHCQRVLLCVAGLPLTLKGEPMEAA
ncbi:bifunctional adenosylcobinamide kinase/adenosylcobinamide-phosphate guanylyltransferase [Rhabdochromatium marinum]|uniref:bifunctional adenosylcobinamide kinase/adenosylcobinamide-phosphate guanylyltransferase n=1 Tax=Rhabdochromatium marinum TaxID=48729 RepID=UPI001907DA2B|nr:bifunctional adenosylcobinamide kinase/adenosylcobinamide-phosphate guanylyltransferase [Rhabdochromatium marinum]MBK1650560.1 bifunctional adenosylcobinamide kinase/adenosylcobinamide-phosphate guanylyltransferase [Rhabdochromatium marinum]